MIIEVIDAKEETPSPTCNHDNAEIYQFVFFNSKEEEENAAAKRWASHGWVKSLNSSQFHKRKDSFWFDVGFACNCIKWIANCDLPGSEESKPGGGCADRGPGVPPDPGDLTSSFTAPPYDSDELGGLWKTWKIKRKLWLIIFINMYDIFGDNNVIEYN